MDPAVQPPNRGHHLAKAAPAERSQLLEMCAVRREKPREPLRQLSTARRHKLRYRRGGCRARVHRPCCAARAAFVCALRCSRSNHLAEYVCAQLRLLLLLLLRKLLCRALLRALLPRQTQRRQHAARGHAQPA